MGYALYDSDSNLYEKGKILLSSQAENKHEKLNHAFLIEKGGFMETFLVNETSQDVFFDNFRIQSTPSTTVQVTHYYPFGMEMPALSYQAPAMNKNRYLYNQGVGEITFDTERIPDLNIDLTKFRAYDPALGRWWQIDPMADALSSLTPYNYSFNNPVLFNDPLGDYPTGNSSNIDTEQRKEQDQARTQGQTSDFFARNSGRQSGGGGGIMKYVPKPSGYGGKSSKNDTQSESHNNQSKLVEDEADTKEARTITLRPLAMTLEAGVTLAAEAGLISATTAAALHSNNKNSKKPNIVYEIFTFDLFTGEYITQKFGISSMKDFVTKSGNPRPEYQVAAFNVLEFQQAGSRLWGYQTLYRTETRDEALEIEKSLVRSHRSIHGPLSLPLNIRPH
jgi:RHS repeat-associated protein